MMLYQAPGVSQACEDTPIVAKAEYTISTRSIVPSASIADANSGMEFVHVTGGCYCMGADAGKGLRDAKPAHEVCVDDYYMGKYEVTQAQWRAIMGSNPSTINSCGDNCPVVDVSWQEVQEFTRRLNERTGKNFRLPTEAEWEYAVRSGGLQETRDIASASSEVGHLLRPVGWSQPNGLGIYDMQGSVWEWTSDWYGKHYYTNSPTNNPEGPTDGLYRVLRGGSWTDTQKSLNPTLRLKYEPWIKRPWAGFRLLSPDQYSAKFKSPEALAPEMNASRSRQCEPIQHAFVR